VINPDGWLYEKKALLKPLLAISTLNPATQCQLSKRGKASYPFSLNPHPDLAQAFFFPKKLMIFPPPPPAFFFAPAFP
jgi:hypothetical protein